MLVRERMFSPGKWISPSFPISSVIETFDQTNPHWLPVVDPEGRLIGLITRSDIQKAKETNFVITLRVSKKRKKKENKE